MISPIDDRYHKKVEELEKFFSEKSFTRYRVEIELKYLKEISELMGIFTHVDMKQFDFKKIKEIEQKIRHDVKAIEYYVAQNNPEISNYVHFGLTSEDTNNLAYCLMIKDFLEVEYLPLTDTLIGKIAGLSDEYKDVSMLARTHGQVATPTTFGKELIVFASRLDWYYEKIKGQKIYGKMNGAVGNFNAMQFASPGIDWISFTKNFVEELGLEYRLVSTQINSDEDKIDIFSYCKNLNNVLIDLCQDMWGYISMDYLKQKHVAEEVGSSTMPHKINPIHFENSEGNLKIANSFYDLFIDTLSKSRFQRDLSSSTIKRNIGVGLSHSILAYKSLIEGLDRIGPNKRKMSSELRNHPEVLTEAIQTYFRYKGLDSYDTVKNLSRGKKVNIQQIIDKLSKSDIHTESLSRLTPKGYIGLAIEIVESELKKLKR